MSPELLAGFAGLAVYGILKLGGYVGWSYAGLKWLGRGSPRPIFNAVALGILRLMIGWFTGIGVGVLIVRSLDRLPIFYFTGLVVVRWFEWALIQALIPEGGGTGRGFLTAGSTAGRLWRLVGIVISYAADAPFLLASGGFPHGRMFC